jgi:hypothetical protein
MEIKKISSSNWEFETPKSKAPLQIRLEWLSQTAIMSSEKRPASDEFASSQMVVKRQNLGKDSKAVAVVNGSGGNGAVIQAVCTLWGASEFMC